MNLKDFATHSMPLHASSLPSLLRCPRGELIKLMYEGGSTQAADTGCAIHKAIAAYHTHAEGDLTAALRDMESHLSEYPLANLGTAEEHFRHYADDERNKEAKVILCEEQIQISLPPPEGYFTEEAATVEIVGTVDQVRDIDGVLTVCDIKTGGVNDGTDMLSYYAAQLAAYQVGASERLGKHVPAACIIRTRDYLIVDRKRQPRPGPVFWHASWTYDDALAMLDAVRRIVGDIRAGWIHVAPSPDNCRWCIGGGIANCLRRKVE